MQDILKPAEWGVLAALSFAVVSLHIVGWATLLLFVVPQHYKVRDGSTFGVGLGLTAYTLGLRHAFDADHIAGDRYSGTLANQ